eukprot:CAMPEP_0181205394 /NCGR_PEP_ID=MMETSP1096-20121128/20452_1 /TAXON_ID=156174 ORGANISM="Chrysochromulina ericina, Strain CCMP281" /NCGR_SAMPLE_ID=MMETSP1096 /ASSEMBLY_ACC=CAM_ASM_000453 /LENGTH=74 /DNA_ID=CAMNT_0023296171 /DNA_START=480 /DNA_END=700 /DNA_ORIENTATION=-
MHSNDAQRTCAAQGPQEKQKRHMQKPKRCMQQTERAKLFCSSPQHRRALHCRLLRATADVTEAATTAPHVPWPS